MSPRVALVGMILESNRFAKPAEREDFTDFVWVEGDSLLSEARKKTSVIAPEFGGFVRARMQQENGSRYHACSRPAIPPALFAKLFLRK